MNKVYITKYCLTRGIEEFDLIVTDSSNYAMRPPDGKTAIRAGNSPRVWVKRSGEFETNYKFGADAFLTLEMAKEQARKLQKAKVRSLSNQLKRIQEWDFS